MEVLAILRVDNLTCLANVSAKHFLHVTFLQIRIFHEATTSFLAFILFSEIAWSTLHGATIQRKTPAQDWGKCLRAGGLEGLFFLAVSPEVVNLDSNLRYKVNHLYDYINSNKVNELKKYEINR